jgi:hypothetical protein
MIEEGGGRSFEVLSESSDFNTDSISGFVLARFTFRYVRQVRSMMNLQQSL